MDSIDLRSPEAVIRALRLGAEANHTSGCRHGSIDRIGAPGVLVATGDLHDNPLHSSRVLEIAGLDGRGDGSHVTLHELIHAERLTNGMDFSHRALVRVAALKAEYPERVHTLLANHELAQVLGSGIIKDGVLVVEAFNEGVEYAFGADAPGVHGAIAQFIRSMPLALRCSTPRGDILCSHSLPGPAMMQRFDPSILDRDLVEDDYAPRRGSAHLMVWGRGYDAEQLEDLVERWGVNMFILGHEHVDNGIMLIEPNAIVLNSDHARGVCVRIDLDDPSTPSELVGRAIPLG